MSRANAAQVGDLQQRINVNSNVLEKAVRYPTNARLYDRLRERLIKSARKNGIELRQTYERIAGKSFTRSKRLSERQSVLAGRKNYEIIESFRGCVAPNGK